MSKETVGNIRKLIDTADGDTKAAFDSMQPENLPIETIKPYYDVNNKGVFYYGVNSDQTEHRKPLRLCDGFYLIGQGQDKHRCHYRIIRWHDRYETRDRTDALPMEIVGTRECWQYLRKRGIAVSSKRTHMELLTSYIQEWSSTDRWRITDKVGWHGKAYILPSGELLSDADSPAKIIYQGDTSQADCFTQSGSLKDWQAQIGRYVSGNSRLLLAMGASFAAPLLYLLDEESGGFHFYGDSSDGKTTLTRAALSVWGHGKDAMVQWNGTALAFENVSLARNDCLLVLDEMRQADLSTIKRTAYSLFNGQGKIQGAKDGGNRTVNKWRILALSTGERAMQTFLHDDGYAGQAVRLPDIPANAGKGLGVYDTLHNQTSGAALSEHLSDASQKQYGTAGKAFILALIADTQAKQTIRTETKAFLSTLPELEGQARRIGNRFALAAAALVMAARYGVLSLTKEDIHAGIKTCFDAWEKEAGGLGKREDREILENTADWFASAAHSRFDTIPDDAIPHSSPNSAGYREALADGKTAYYVFPKVFKVEIVGQYQKTKVCEVLYQHQWLVKEDTKGYQSRKQIGSERQRFYKFIGALPPCMDEPDQPPDANPPDTDIPD